MNMSGEVRPQGSVVKDGGGAFARPQVISVVGLKKSGKTSVVEAIVRGLTSRGFTAGTVKSMHHSVLTLDVKGKDTFRHRSAGGDFVLALSKGETALIWDTPERLTLEDILARIPKPVDFLVCEGLEDAGADGDILVVMAVWDEAGIAATRDVRTITGRLVAYSGRYANLAAEHDGKPVFNVLSDEGAGGLVDLLLEECGKGT